MPKNSDAPLPVGWRVRPNELITGRPKALASDQQTLATIRECGRHQFGVEPTAAFLGVAVTTLRVFFREHPEIKELFDLSKEQGKGILHGYQFAAAAKGDRTMLVWLGKQYLNQRDKMDVNPNLPNATNPDDVLDKLESILAGKSVGEPIPAGEARPSKRLN